MTTLWPSDGYFPNQRAFMLEFEDKLTRLEQRSLPATVHKTSEPAEADFQSAFAARHGLLPSTIPVHSRLQWFNPDTGRIEDHFHVITDAGGGASSGSILTAAPIPDDLNWEVFLDWVAETDGSGPPAALTVPQTHYHLAILYSVRFTASALAKPFEFRFNADAATAYSTQNAWVTGAAFSGGEYLAQDSVNLYLVPADSADENQFGNGSIMIYGYSDDAHYKSGIGWVTAFWGPSPTSGERALSLNQFTWTKTTPITQLNFLATEGVSFSRGSRITVYGVTPK